MTKVDTVSLRFSVYVYVCVFRTTQTLCADARLYLFRFTVFMTFSSIIRLLVSSLLVSCAFPSDLVSCDISEKPQRIHFAKAR